MEKQNCVSTGIKLGETGFGYTLSVIGGKYKMIVLFWLYHNPPAMRFNELKRRIGTISFKTLSGTLKELEIDELIIRTEYPQIPPKVEYALSPRGFSLMPILNSMCQ
ncbi:helix-turn-helix transcriptional regulator [Aggregatibacter actinomycetemcomitans]|nr:helix-turn-helix transcriptional regulator [Aggregatibacter actinomycetemcomitans]